MGVSEAVVEPIIEAVGRARYFEWLPLVAFPLPGCLRGQDAGLRSIFKRFFQALSQ
jgi:hypothetical protein